MECSWPVSGLNAMCTLCGSVHSQHVARPATPQAVDQAEDEEAALRENVTRQLQEAQTYSRDMHEVLPPAFLRITADHQPLQTAEVCDGRVRLAPHSSPEECTAACSP